MGKDLGDAEVIDLDVLTVGDEVVCLVIMVPEDVGVEVV